MFLDFLPRKADKRRLYVEIRVVPMLLQKLQAARVSPLRGARARDGVYFAHADLLKIKTAKQASRKREKKKKKRKRRVVPGGTLNSCPHETVTMLKVRFSMNAKSQPFSFVPFFIFCFLPPNSPSKYGN
jgi:hypothetical protein